VKTKVIRPDPPEKGWTEAVTLVLRDGDVVALPTETVYGLAADARNAQAVAKIFEAKERPRFDPLIVHLPDSDWLEKVADIPAPDRPLIARLAEAFWPGPFTMVLPKRSLIPGIVTAGLETVAVRISAHPIFNEIIRAFGGLLAAPSANRFGRISPTTAQHVVDELAGRIPLIVEGGPTRHGIESTIVAVREGRLEILRRGPITAEQLAPFAAIMETIDSPENISAPGQLPSHYAPNAPVQLVDQAGSFCPGKNQRVGLLAWNPAADGTRFAMVRNLSEAQDLREAAANLFRYLRELDQREVDLIVVERVPEIGLGAAIMDRLRRASHRRTNRPGRPARIL